MNKNSYFPYIVQTTKRWGIRVFLYQTMQRYIKIVKMHKKNKNYWTFMLKYTNIELTVKRNKKQEGNKRMKGNVIVGQSGGPTAAINASLAGVYRTAKDRGANKVYGMLHGIQGLLKEKYIDLSDHIKTELDAELLKRTPAAFLGSCRYKLPEIHENREVYDI